MGPEAKISHVPADLTSFFAGGGGDAAETFASAYLTDEGLPENPADAAWRLTTHLRLGRSRPQQTDLVQIVTQDADGAPERWAVWLQVVTEDRPFIVDTCTTRLAEEGWNLRRVWHPILDVGRDGEGTLLGPDADGTPESWLSVEAYPPLGTSAADKIPGLLDAIRDGLAASRVVEQDESAMRMAALDVAKQVRAAGVREGVQGNPDDVADLLTWLTTGHFEFFGYRHYHAEGDDFSADRSSGLGLLRRAEGEEFSARRPGFDDSTLLVVTRDSRRSPLHRGGFLDYVGVREFDGSGALIGEHRFLGMRSASALSEPLSGIPVLASKAQRIRERLRYDPEGHSGQVLEETLAMFPRQLLFEGDTASLAADIDQIASVQERRTTRLFLRRSRYGRFWTCLLYLPRDRYRTAVRERIEALLLERLHGVSLEFQASVTESSMARLMFVVKTTDETGKGEIDAAAVQEAVIAATRMWEDDFNDAAAHLPTQQRGVTFGDAYIEAHTVKQALADLRLANQLDGPNDLRFALYRADAADDAADLRFKIITRERLSLSRVMPHLDALGITVIDERPFHWDLRGEHVSLFDFGFQLPAGQSMSDWNLADRARFADAFAASYQGRAYPGKLNQLVMTAGLTWQEITWLRALARYLRQAGTPYSQQYIASALNANPQLAAALVGAFRVRFDPAIEQDMATRDAQFADRIASIERTLDEVESLDQDRIIRMCVAVLLASDRTNAFAAGQDALALKLRPTELPMLPEPRPAHEIFVYSPRVEGVHLRFGAVARGGLRWSDRSEDYRTEVLGLVKAQMVKNTVIVPVGAKGGFVPQRLPDPRLDRAGWLAEGQATYRIFINALLSVTDNLVQGMVVPPANVVRHDGDDTYLVVAADKGTASFSDLANGIALERGFWLGDAFASGGSVGYDHKGMGITARGAWESVKRHFYELGLDPQTTDFTCLGIGDMSGDVFGNGMLLSKHIRLVAAFNHQHIFLDPNPDPETSWAERKRLFELPRSTWADYDTALISAGGGVFERSAKSVPINARAREALGLPPGVSRLTPAELMKSILQAPVDLFWNGGIGTYVKAESETNADVGDKANDALRVNGSQVRARVAVEGGNLGWTLLGRVEYAKSGGRMNADFIDNSAGVDTSDHEVNIKILLAPAVSQGRLDAEHRVALLESMTDEVAALVLAHNIDQNLALSVEQAQKPALAAASETWMRELEASAGMSRTLEGLPSRKEMASRIQAGIPLTRPELSSLMAWTKIYLERLVVASKLPDDPYLADRLVSYFPPEVRETYAADMLQHPLHREIVTMVTVNRFVNSQGISAYSRLSGETASDITEVVKAQLAARTIFSVARFELALPKLALPAAAELKVRVALQQMIERGTRWLLHNRRGDLDIKAEAAAFTDGVRAVLATFESQATPRQQSIMAEQVAALVAAGVPTDIAGATSRALWAHQALPIVDLARTQERPLELVSSVYFAISAQLGLDVVFDRVNDLDRSTRWDTMARAALRDDLQTLQTELTRAALRAAPEASDSETVVAAWQVAVGGVDREAAQLAEITDGEATLARMSVALRTIRTLLV